MHFPLDRVDSNNKKTNIKNFSILFRFEPRKHFQLNLRNYEPLIVTSL
jgi:hypothetical protein